MKNLIKILLTVMIVASCASSASAQFWSRKKNKAAEDSVFVSGLNDEQELIRSLVARYAIPTIQYEPVTPPKFWKCGIMNQLGFSQVALSNWAAGGSNSLAFNAYINATANYNKGNVSWENRLQTAYGFIESAKDGHRKSDDRLIIDSKFGYRTVKDLYMSATFNFSSQFTPGYDYPSGENARLVSRFLAPGYFKLGLGMEYKKGTWLSLNFSPLTAGATVVTDEDLRKKYGNEIDEEIRYQLGAQLNLRNNFTIAKTFKISSALTLFSDYKYKPKNLQVKWDFLAELQINKYFSTILNINMIYDDNVKNIEKDEITGLDVIRGPKLQTMEMLSVAFTYTFGAYTK